MVGVTTSGVGSWLFPVLGVGALVAVYGVLFQRPKLEPFGRTVALVGILMVVGRIGRTGPVSNLVDPVVGSVLSVRNSMAFVDYLVFAIALMVLLESNLKLIYPRLCTLRSGMATRASLVLVISTLIWSYMNSDLRSSQSSYLPAVFDGSVSETVFFGLFTLAILVTGLSLLWVSFSGYRWSIGHVRQVFIICAVIGFLVTFESVHEFGTVFVLGGLHYAVDSWYAAHVIAISEAIVGTVFALYVLAVAGYSISGLVARVHRYRVLRRQLNSWIELRDSSRDIEWFEFPLPEPSRRSCWQASSTSVATYRMMIEISDSRFVGYV